MGSQTATDIPEIPEQYSKLSTETIQILRLIFFPYKEEDLPNIKSFLHLYTEIFNYFEKHTLPEEQLEGVDEDSKLLKKCIQKHREVFRQCFRGVQYVPTIKFHDIAGKSLSAATSSLLSEDMNNLESIKTRIKLEHNWIDVVNEKRRTNDLELYKTESINKCMATIRQKFPILFDSTILNRMDYIDEQVLNRKLVKILALSKKQFLSELPFRDEESELVVTQEVLKFERMLEEKIATDLIARNLERKKLADTYTEDIVAESVNEYRDNMETFLLTDYKNCVLDVKVVLKEHKNLIETKLSSLAARGSLNRTKNLEVTFLNTYQTEAHAVLKIILRTWAENVKIQLKSNERNGKLEICDSFRNIAKKFGEIGKGDIANGFKSHIEETLADMFQHVQDANQAAIIKLENLTKPSFEQEGKSNKDFKRNCQSWKILYMKTIVNEFRHFTKETLTLKDTIKVIETFHSAKINVLRIIDQQYPDLHMEDIEVLEYFMDEVKDELLKNRGLLLEITRKFSDSAVKFQETCQKDFIFKSGVFTPIEGRLQSILSTSVLSDVSFEELRFNEWKLQHHIFTRGIS